MWHQLIGELDLAEALEAVRQHYRVEHRWVMPSDVIELVNESRRQRREIEQQREVNQAAKVRWCERVGVTVEEYDRRFAAADYDWIRAKDGALRVVES